MKIIFEDHCDKAISNMILDVLSREIAEFVGGDGNIQDYIESLDKDEEIFTYCDVIPDNVETLELYEGLKKLRTGHKNLVVVPIPCMEFCVMKSIYTRFGHLGTMPECLMLRYNSTKALSI